MMGRLNHDQQQLFYSFRLDEGEGRTAKLPLVGSLHELDPNAIHQVCEALGLKRSDLPRAKGPHLE